MLLGSSEINIKLNKLNDWKLDNNGIVKEYALKDFISIINFVNKAANAAEEMNHHPDIFIHSWNKVKFTISTHSEGGITEKDFNLAEEIEHLSKSF